MAGARLGSRDAAGRDHSGADCRSIFTLRFDDDDRAAIAEASSRGKRLMTVLGDCGGEYRRRRS